MTELKNTTICRCGITARQFNFETDLCSFEINSSKRPVDFRFNLASKGGGTTAVSCEIGLDDVQLILEQLAIERPEEIVEMLTDCAALANKNIRERLAESRREQNDEKLRLSRAVEQLEVVEEFVLQKYYEAPAGQDETEAAINSQLGDVVNSLREMSL